MMRTFGRLSPIAAGSRVLPASACCLGLPNTKDHTVQATPSHLVMGATALVSLAAFARSADAAVRYVALCGSDGWSGTAINCLGPTGPKRTIQAAIDSAVDGDTIIVLAGTHVGAIDFDGKELTLVSASGPAFTILTRDDEGPIVTCNSAESSDAVLQGFTLRDGFSFTQGAALRCVLCEPSIVDCVFDENIALGGGGAVSLLLASPSFTGCSFTSNNDIIPIMGVRGGAVLAQYGHPTFVDCSFVDNHATDLGGAVALVDGADAVFENCDFVSNSTWLQGQETKGAAIGCIDGEITCEECTFVGNISAGEGGGAGLLDSTAHFQACTFDGNIAENLHAGGIRATDSVVTLIGCGFFDNRSNGYGAAMSATFSTISITLCGFHDNGLAGPGGVGPSTRGGALWVSYSDTSIAASTFSGNRSTEDGGAITVGGFPFDDDETSISACTFSGNETDDEGGAISIANGNGSISNSTFTGNGAHFGGAINGKRSSDSPEYPPSFLDISDCTFTGNSAFTAGGVRLVSDGAVTACEFLDNVAEWVGGGLTVSIPATVRVLDSLFDGNSAVSGGGMTAGSNGCTIVGCTFTDNSAITGGALISTVATQTASVANTLFANNTASDSGAAFGVGSGGGLRVVNALVHHNTAPSDGAAIWNYSGTIDLANCTIANNTGGGVLSHEFASATAIVNSIVWGNTSGADVAGPATSVRYSNVQDGAAGEGNMNGNPKFAGALGGNYHLLPGSPCVDAGLNWLARADADDLDGDGITNELTPIDFDGNPRIADAAARDTGCGLGAVVDLGAFEVRGTPVANAILADLNGDGVVNAPDLAILLGAWGEDTCLADLNGDGEVNASDLGILLGAWG
jgi:predicted outer membrane repeat protein